MWRRWLKRQSKELWQVVGCQEQLFFCLLPTFIHINVKRREHRQAASHSLAVQCDYHEKNETSTTLRKSVSTSYYLRPRPPGSTETACGSRWPERWHPTGTYYRGNVSLVGWSEDGRIFRIVIFIIIIAGTVTGTTFGFMLVGIFTFIVIIVIKRVIQAPQRNTFVKSVIAIQNTSTR